MKSEKEIFEEYKKFPSRSTPVLFGKKKHWEGYYEGYEMGYQAAVEESQASLEKELGMDLKNFPANVGEQFQVMKEALQKYYKEKGESK